MAKKMNMNMPKTPKVQMPKAKGGASTPFIQMKQGKMSLNPSKANATVCDY